MLNDHIRRGNTHEKGVFSACISACELLAVLSSFIKRCVVGRSAF